MKLAIFFGLGSYIDIVDMLCRRIAPEVLTENARGFRGGLGCDVPVNIDIERAGIVMYRKAVSLLMLGNMVLVLGFLCVRGVEWIRHVQPVSVLSLADVEKRDVEMGQAAGEVVCMVPQEGGFASGHGIGIMDIAVSDQRVVGYGLIEQRLAYDLSDEELEVLLRIVEAEAGSEDEDGRLLVANVVLNRVGSDKFPSTITDVVFQRNDGVTQFSPVSSGSYYRVKISDETVSAVSRALNGEDISQGALYFVSRKRADSSKMRWFDTSLTFLFQHGGHEFFK